MKRLFIISVLILSFIAGCATMAHSNKQFVHFTTAPGDAEVYINGERKGNTPLVIELSVETEHIIEIRKGNEVLFRTTIGQVISNWFWGNFATILPFGMVVDYVTGSMYRLSPDHLHFSSVNALNSPEKRFILVIKDTELDVGF